MGSIQPTQSIYIEKGKSYVDYAVGYNRVTYFLNLGGGLEQSVLVNNARRNMYIANPLEKGQFFDNITVDFKIKNFILFSTMEVIVMADIIQVADTNNYVTYQTYTGINIENKRYHLGEKVYVTHDEDIYLGKVISFLEPRMVVAYVDKTGEMNVEKVGLLDVYHSQNKELKKEIQSTQLVIGSNVKYNLPYVNREHEGVIVGFNDKYALVEHSSGSRYIVLKSKITILP